MYILSMPNRNPHAGCFSNDAISTNKEAIEIHVRKWKQNFPGKMPRYKKQNAGITFQSLE